MDNKITEDGLKKLILLIARKSQNVDMTLTRTRLIKLLYLIDEAYYMRYGELYTGFKWVYWYYGPYSHDLAPIREKMVGDTLGERPFEDGTKEGYAYSTEEDIDSGDLYGDVDVQLLVDRILNKWVEKSTGDVLSYVYDDSPPMWGVEKGESLKFENINRLKQEREYHRRVISKINESLREHPKWQEMKKWVRENKPIIKRDLSDLPPRLIIDLDD